MEEKKTVEVCFGGITKMNSFLVCAPLASCLVFRGQSPVSLL